MTCEDCLHIEVCAYIKPDLPICSDFADRSRYVVQKNGEWKLVEFQSSPFDTDQALVCSCCGLRELRSQQLEIDMKMQSNLVTLNKDAQWTS